MDATDASQIIAAKQQIYYHAINVAFLEFVFHKRVDRFRRMAQLAADHASEEPQHAWSIATLAESRLYLDDQAGALALYRRLVTEGGDPWQFASGMQAARVAAALDDRLLAEALEGIFTPGARQTDRIFVAVALVTPDFLASDFVWRYEMPEILRAAREDRLRLLWAHVSPAEWEETPLRNFQAAHDTSTPIALLGRAEQDVVLKGIAREIKRAALGATDRFVT